MPDTLRLVAYLSLCLAQYAVVARAAEPAKPAPPAKPTPQATAEKKPPVKKPPVAAKPVPPEPTFECRWASGRIQIDGRADEPAWAAAPMIDGFTTPWTKGGPTLPQEATRSRLLWDGANLYFYAEMDDADLFAEFRNHDDPIWTDDVFELFLKPAFDKHGYYEFEVNAVGAQFDIFIPERDAQPFVEILRKEIFTWQTAVVRRGTLNDAGDRDSGWAVEGRIPWIDLIACGGRPAAGEAWQFALCRGNHAAQRKNDGKRLKPELTTTAPLTQADFHRHEEFPRIRFVGSEEAAKPYGLTERVPLTTSKVVGAPEPPPPFHTVRAYPQLKLNHLIMAKPEPGTRTLLALVQPGGGKTNLVRFADDPKVAEFETLHEFEGTAYDFTFHPRFAENGQLFVGWNGPPGDAFAKKECIVSRFTFDRASPRKLDAASELRILSWPSNGHDGLAVVFGNDGMFYVTSGDGTSDSDTNLTGQDMTQLYSKLMRLDVDHVRPEDAAAGRAYSVPPDNPFVGREGIRPETWSYGFRNPWRMAVDRATGHIWVTQNGQDLYEQVYLCRPGENYGWSVMEGSQPFYLERKRGPTPIVPPTVEHPHSEARSLTGGIVYDGAKHPSLRGAYLYGDYATGKIWMVSHDGTRVTESREIADTTLALTAIVQTVDGDILAADYRPKDESALYYLEPTPPVAAPSNFPRKLSESGLFALNKSGRGVDGHRMVPGVVPYAVNSPLWSDGTYKERFMAVPGDEKVNPEGRRSWSFPEGTVLVKSFALEATAGDPRSRRWIETRFLTKQQNEWIGYSYQWNDEQTDAELVGAKGADRTFTVRDADAPDGRRTQTWHYPSRAECMLCHSRAANYVLGISTAQLNCELDYGGVRDNQLRALSHSGLLSRPVGGDWREVTMHALREAGLNTAQASGYWTYTASAKSQRRPVDRPTADTDAELLERLVDPADETAPLDARARSYLHANCAHCHVPAGGGNAQFQIQFFQTLGETKILDERPLHAAFGLPDPRIVAPGAPERSTLVYRTGLDGRGRMPPIGVSVVDRMGADLLRRWVEAMPKERRPTRVDP